MDEISRGVELRIAIAIMIDVPRKKSDKVVVYLSSHQHEYHGSTYPHSCHLAGFKFQIFVYILPMHSYSTGEHIWQRDTPIPCKVVKKN